MKVQTDSERVRHSRKLVLELLVVLGRHVARERMRSKRIHGALRCVVPDRFGEPGTTRTSTTSATQNAVPGITIRSVTARAPQTVAQPVKIHDEMYVRDYSKLHSLLQVRGSLRRRCAEHASRSAVAGRGFDARNLDRVRYTALDDSACVYCGNCIGVCPTGARSCSKPSTITAKPVPGMSPSSPSHEPSARIAVSAATSSYTFRTMRSFA